MKASTIALWVGGASAAVVGGYFAFRPKAPYRPEDGDSVFADGQNVFTQFQGLEYKLSELYPNAITPDGVRVDGLKWVSYGPNDRGAIHGQVASAIGTILVYMPPNAVIRKVPT